MDYLLELGLFIFWLGGIFGIMIGSLGENLVASALGFSLGILIGYIINKIVQIKSVREVENE